MHEIHASYNVISFLFMLRNTILKDKFFLVHFFVSKF